MKLIKAPENLPEIESPSLFLAGSIEQGKAEDWQAVLTDKLLSFQGTILSPRRDNSDASWPNTPEHKGFNEQVNWELDNIERADLVLFYFQAETLSPISLLEFGYVAGQVDNEYRKPILVCPKNFWRYGNVRITADRKGISVYESLTDALPELKRELIRIRSDYI